MSKKRAQLDLITLWHPNIWFGIDSSQLSSLPHLVKSKTEMERRRKEEAERHGLTAYWTIFHNEPVLNVGRSIDQFRQTWIPTKNLVPCLQALEPRLIDTRHSGSQSRWRLEYRSPQYWSQEPNSLSEELKHTAIEKVGSNKIYKLGMVSIRQLWINPRVENVSPALFLRWDVGMMVEDPSALDGCCRYMLSTDSAGRLVWCPLSTLPPGYYWVSFDLKVASKSQSQRVATIAAYCKGRVPNSRAIKASAFRQDGVWQSFSLYTEVGEKDSELELQLYFHPGVTDLSCDLVGTIPGVANLVLGPGDRAESTREAKLDVEHKNDLWWVVHSE